MPPHLRQRRAARRATAGVALAAALAVGIPSPAPADPITDTDRTIEALRRQADRAAEQYFDTLAEVQALEAEIAKVEKQLPQLEARRRELRVAARDRAVAAYKRRGIQLGSLFGAGDALALARRKRFLDGLNAADNLAFDELTRITERLEGERKRLGDARAALRTTLDDLDARGREIDAKLRAAEDRRRRLQAATTSTTAAATPRAGAPASAQPAPLPDPPYLGTPGTHPQHNHPFLVCTRGIESGGNYRAYNPAGPYMGAYQFLQSTWNSTANHAGRPELLDVRPDRATEYDQDDMAWVLYQWQGSRPWGGRCG